MSENHGTMAPGTHETNDPMTEHAQGAGVWGLPSEPDHLQAPAHLPPEGFDYSAGVLVGVPGQEADAVPGTIHPTILAKLRSDVPRSYDALHEATHRRYDAPFTVAVNQSAAGTTIIVPARPGLHYIKVLACFITLDAAGTIKFVQGDGNGFTLADISGTINAGGASAPPLALPPADIATPWFFTTPDLALGIVTATGKAQGFLTCCYSPYDS